MWPSGVRSSLEAVCSWAVIFSSFIFAPPPLMRRLASPLESVRPVSTKRSRMGMPASRRALSIVMLGRSSPTLPASKTLIAVSAASLAAGSPWQSLVASKAKIFLASFMSAPSRASSFSISAMGRIVKRRRSVPTIASSTLRQYW